MDRNVGDVDAKIRGVVGAAALSGAFRGKRPLVVRGLLLAVAALLLATAQSHKCPVYDKLGVNTLDNQLPTAE